MLPPPGWHPQPDGRERFWDGEQWTSSFRPGQLTPPPAAAPSSPLAGLTSKPWARFVGVGLLGFVVGGMMFGGGSRSTAAPEPAPTTTVTATETVTARTTVTAETTVTVVAVPEATSAEETPAPVQTAAAPAAAATEVEVPDATGMNYQQAQDRWRSLGLLVGVATDATGANRLALLDSNWFVVDQDIAPGTTVATGTMITATVKKYTDD